MADKSKIATLTLHPALDMTVRVDDLRLGEVNRAQGMQVSAGGKGVNVASFLAQSGFRVAASGFLGEENAQVFERHFAHFGIEDRFIRIPGSTRSAVKLVDEAGQQTTDINLPGPAPSAEAMDRLAAVMDGLTEECAWIAFSGSLPPGVDARTYAGLIERARARGCRVALDSSGEALRSGIAGRAAPNLVKPNLRELEELSGRSLEDQDELLAAARGLLANGIELVVVSMGERGALFVQAEQAVLALPPPVAVVRSAVAAGDALLAGTITGSMRGLNLPETARLATAWAAGKLAFATARLPGEAELSSLAAAVTVRAVH